MRRGGRNWKLEAFSRPDLLPFLCPRLRTHLRPAHRTLLLRKEKNGEKEHKRKLGKVGHLTWSARPRRRRSFVDGIGVKVELCVQVRSSLSTFSAFPGTSPATCHPSSNSSASRPRTSLSRPRRQRSRCCRRSRLLVDPSKGGSTRPVRPARSQRRGQSGRAHTRR